MRSARRTAACGDSAATSGVARNQHCSLPAPCSTHSPARPSGGERSAGSKRTGPCLASAAASKSAH
eukprot:14864068-Alexandrium_andersonii.AAC.1